MLIIKKQILKIPFKSAFLYFLLCRQDIKSFKKKINSSLKLFFLYFSQYLFIHVLYIVFDLKFELLQVSLKFDDDLV